MIIYELQPCNGQKSFYGKAIILRDNDGNETLLSYGTEIVKRYTNGYLQRLWDGWSATTGKHIKAFCGLNKKAFDKLSYSDDCYQTDDDC